MCARWRVTRWRRRFATAIWSCSTWAEPLDDQVFVVLTGEGVVVKRLRRRDDPWELKSDNPAYESRAVTGQDRILGQVAWTRPPSAGPPKQAAKNLFMFALGSPS